ncbi:hypothetical protein FGO68_gene3049 [Halteria grandinella]|uniref:Uncharacterized protein n=1 Tax=Halteria grandinella TaxID=5974 RepID=A0A8J8NZR5_HALGN|nr:hypothetical protein FGO68_gene3049 [Halteria grandinella]
MKTLLLLLQRQVILLRHHLLIDRTDYQQEDKIINPSPLMISYSTINSIEAMSNLCSHIKTNTIFQISPFSQITHQHSS